MSEMVYRCFYAVYLVSFFIPLVLACDGTFPEEHRGAMVLRIYDLHRMDYRFWLTFSPKIIGRPRCYHDFGRYHPTCCQHGVGLIRRLHLWFPCLSLTGLPSTFHSKRAAWLLMLGAVIGMLNLILLLFTNDKIWLTPQGPSELSIISEITLLGGLFMVSIGTYQEVFGPTNH